MNDKCAGYHCPFYQKITILKQVESMFLLDDDVICTLSHDGCGGKKDSTHLNSGCGSAMNTDQRLSHHDQTDHSLKPPSTNKEGKTVRPPTRCKFQMDATHFKALYRQEYMSTLCRTKSRICNTVANSDAGCKFLSEGDLPGLTTLAITINQVKHYSPVSYTVHTAIQSERNKG